LIIIVITVTPINYGLEIFLQVFAYSAIISVISRT